MASQRTGFQTIGFDVAARCGGWVSVTEKRFAGGADPTGVADSTAAWTAAKATGRRTYWPNGTYNITSLGEITVDIIGESKTGVTIRRTSTSNMSSALHPGVTIRDATIDGNASSYATGQGIYVPASYGSQTIDNARIQNFPGPAIEFQADGGSEFKSVNSTYHTTAAQGVGAAVKVTGTDTAAVPRHFTNTESKGCTLFDFGGASDFFAVNFYTNGLIYGAAANKVMIHGARLGDQGGTITINGGDHVLRGISATPLIIAGTGCIVDCQAPSWNITDSGSGNSILMVNRAHTPALTNSSAAIGNATVYSRWAREGRRVTVEYDITWGSTTNAGSSALQISLPVAANAAAPVQLSGSFLIANAASSTFALAAPRIVNGASDFRLYGDFGVVTATAPITFATGDILRGTVTYTVP